MDIIILHFVAITPPVKHPATAGFIRSFLARNLFGVGGLSLEGD